MTEKAYIVANKEQELEVLNELDEYGFMWGTGDKPSAFIPSEKFRFTEADFPYMLIANDIVWWSTMDKMKNKTIVFDGRKEDEEVDTRYKVTQEFMNKLIEWRDNEHIKPTSDKVNSYVSKTNLINLPAIVENWWVWGSKKSIENNNRLIAIIQWLNGEEVFELKKAHSFVVRNDKPNNSGNFWYVEVFKEKTTINFYISGATKFDTQEEAQEWANSHQVVVEIDEYGNEVE